MASGAKSGFPASAQPAAIYRPVYSLGLILCYRSLDELNLYKDTGGTFPVIEGTFPVIESTYSAHPSEPELRVVSPGPFAAQH